MENELLMGLREHLERARMFYSEACQTSDSLIRHRKLIAAVYFCQAFQEHMLDTADRGMTVVSGCDLEKRLLEILPHSRLVYIVRIHDFHRMTFTQHEGYRMQGPVKAITGNRAGDSIVLSIEGGLPTEVAKKGNSRLKLDRPLVTLDGAVLDADSGQYFPLQLL